ncbi:uncharacterized protein MELLADRAFT_65952 [Melampsora larici-populina 98AG31]|uniref:Uncharacterized protein n=1 Tax=Melampsora larici-populina (strain 98AG31 / pathotype 3-4-7) TaxID=747676 RepID=F4RXC2_MELLP|nr:uncharacterized protein MELLADRAFT_65952 [Melampsora larici-populina 98AG31]EGG03010.1 hypothetical protein MELLADRAFT_65952 [Melampsora larici-populina 98AG31]
MSLSLGSFNNHNGLWNHGDGGSPTPDAFTTDCVQNEQSRSPKAPRVGTSASASDRLALRNGPSTPIEVNANSMTGVKYQRSLGPVDLAVWDAMAIDAGLDRDHRKWGRTQAEVIGEHHRYMVQASVQARIVYDLTSMQEKMHTIFESLERLTSRLESHMEANIDSAMAPDSILSHIDVMSDRIARLSRHIEDNPAPATQAVVHADPMPRVGPWAPSTHLQDFFKPLVRRLLTQPTIQAYTTMFDGKGIWIVNSLFNNVKQTVNRQGPAWTTKHLPANIHGVSDVAGTKLYHTTIKNACKHGRAKLHNLVSIVFNNCHDTMPPSACVVLMSFPELLSGIWEVKTGEVSDTPVPTLKELIYKIALKFGTLGDHTDPQSLWNVTSDPTRARIAYLVLQHRLYGRSERIQWQDLQHTISFGLPDEEAIQAGMHQVNVNNDAQTDKNMEASE